MADEMIPSSIAVNTNVFAVQQQGWRGLGLTGDISHRRKVWTVLWNEFVLVTAFVSLPVRWASAIHMRLAN